MATGETDAATNGPTDRSRAGMQMLPTLPTRVCELLSMGPFRFPFTRHRATASSQAALH